MTRPRPGADPALFDLPGDITRGAEVSGCGTYRYTLTRRWAPGPLACWVMLNPSTADADTDDPTIGRCTAFTRAWGHPGFAVYNLYALRATNPNRLWTHTDPVGPDNDQHLQAVAGAPLVVCAWGNHGARDNRGTQVAATLTALGATLSCLKVTASGQPWHPLYTPATLTPMPYQPPEVRR